MALQSEEGSSNLMNAFLKSKQRFAFNVDRLERKYESREPSRTSSKIEVDLVSGKVYAPNGMSSRVVRAEISKYENQNEFGVSQISAPCNGVEIFGNRYKRRMKECARIDAEFDMYFKSSFPNWRPYVATTRRRLQRTHIKETVKEVTFANPMDYLNYVMKRNNIPIDLFKQQDKVTFIPKLALLPEDIRDDESTLVETVLHRGTNWMRSQCANTCNLEQRRGFSAVSGFLHNPMILTADCERSRECSPLRGPLANTAYSSTAHRHSPVPVSHLKEKESSNNILRRIPESKHERFSARSTMPSKVNKDMFVSSIQTVSGETNEKWRLIPAISKNEPLIPRYVFGNTELTQGPTRNAVSPEAAGISGRVLRSRAFQTPKHDSKHPSKSHSRSQPINETRFVTGRWDRTLKKADLWTPKMSKRSGKVKSTFCEKVVRRSEPQSFKKSNYRQNRSTAAKKSEQDLGSCAADVLLRSSSLISPNASDSIHSRDHWAKYTSNSSNLAVSTSSAENVCPPSQNNIPSGLWNENVQAVLNSYDTGYPESKGRSTILGIDTKELRKEVSDEQQTMLSAFLRCASKYQTPHHEFSMVDNGLKEDRRVIAAAKSRNRRLLSGYAV